MSVLDKTITYRQIFRWLCACLAVLAMVYVYFIFRVGWDVKMGGAISTNAPALKILPPSCNGYVRLSRGMPANYILMDSLLLRGRVWRNQIRALDRPQNLMAPCLGYAVLLGLHDPTPGDADFTQEYVDEAGNVVVRIAVEYKKPYILFQGGE